MSGSYAPLFAAAGQQNNVDPRLLAAIAKVESNNDPKAVSKAGALGLMQIMPQTAQALGVQDPTDPTQAVPGAAKLIAQNLDRYGNVADALKAYNAGTDQSRWNNPETNAYVGKVQAAYNALGNSSDPMAGQQTAQAGASDVPLTSVLGGGQSAPSPQGAAPDAFSAAFGNVAPDSSSSSASGGAPDAFSQTFGAVLNAPANDAEAPKPDSFWNNMVAGLQHSVSGSGPVGSTLNRVAQWGDANIPGAQALDNTIGRTADVNQQAVAGSQAGAQQFAQGAGTTWGGTIGNDIGTGVLTAPVAEVAMAPVAGALGAGAGALEAGSVGARLLGAGRNLAAGSGASGIPASVLAASAGGAARGAIASTVAGGSPLTGAEFGAAAGPVGMAVAPLVKGAGGALARTGNSLLDAIEGNAPKAAAANASAANPLIPGAPTAPGAPSIDPNAEPAPPAQTISPNLTKSLPNPGVILTQAGADKAANKIIATYAAGGPTDINANPLIPGSNPTLAQATNNPGLAVLERTIMNDPRAANLMQERINQTNGANQQAMLGIAGTPDDITAAEAARDSATSGARDAAFANAQPVDAQPVVDQIDAIMAANKGNPAVLKPFQAIRNQLVTRVPDPTVDPATGQPTPGAMMDQPISNPQQLYNVRKYMSYLMSPLARNDESNGQSAVAQLMQVKPVLDDTIESGAPGFQKYIQQFDQMSQPINGMQYLQSMNLSDAQGNITLPKLNNAIVSLTKQQNLPGARLADSVTPEQFQALTTLRDSMRRSNLTSINARAYGSPTAQNLGSNALLSALSGNVAHGASIGLGAIGADQALGPVAGLAGMAAGHFAAKAASSVAARSNDMLTQALINKLLNPTAASDAFK